MKPSKFNFFESSHSKNKESLQKYKRAFEE